MDKEKLRAFLDAQIDKYDKMASENMSRSTEIFMNQSGISTGLWLVKSYLDTLEENEG